ncbi:MAG: hypothetical protein ACXWPM_00680 [Bdellovibrionota bacterium]
MAKPKIKKPPPFPFVLEALERASPEIKPMFGCLAIYIDEKMMLVLREREDHPEDNGVWIASTVEHHPSLKRDFPSLRPIAMFSDGSSPAGTQNLPVDAEDFEEAALKACAFILRGDERIGRIPKKKKMPSKKKK